MRSANIGLTGSHEFALCMDVILCVVCDGCVNLNFSISTLSAIHSNVEWAPTELAGTFAFWLSYPFFLSRPARSLSPTSFDCLMAASWQKVDNKVWKQQAYLLSFQLYFNVGHEETRANDAPLYTRVALSRYKFYKVLYVLLTSSSC